MRKESLLKPEICIVDLLMALALVICRHYDSNPVLVKPLELLAIYFFVRMIFVVLPGWSFRLMVMSAMALYAYEISLGLKQWVDALMSRSPVLIVGSFDNPGPYGCLISVFLCLLASYYVILKRDCVQRVICMILCAPGILILPVTQSRTAILSLGVSIFFLAACYYKTKVNRIIRKYGIWILICVVAAGVAGYRFKKPSADGRLYMLRTSAVTMRTNGFKGVGPGHFSGAFGETQRMLFQERMEKQDSDNLDWTVLDENDRLAAECPGHAYNEYMSLGVEYGPGMMLLFIAVIVTAIISSYSKSTIWCYGMTAFAVIAFFSYPFHVKILQTVFISLVAACVADNGGVLIEERSRMKDAENRRGRLVAFSALMAVELVILVSLQSKYPEIKEKRRAETAWRKVEQLHEMECYEDVVEKCDALMPYLKDNGGFLFVYGQALNKTGEYAKSDSILKLGTEVSGDPMFWNVMGNNSLALGRYREAEQRYKHAFYILPNRLYPLTLLAKLYYAEGDMPRFSDMSVKVEAFRPKVESLNTARLRAEIRNLKSGLFTDGTNNDN